MPSHSYQNPKALSTPSSDRPHQLRLSSPPDLDPNTQRPPSSSASSPLYDGQMKKLDAVVFPPAQPLRRLSEAAKNAKHLPLRKRITKDIVAPPLHPPSSTITNNSTFRHAPSHPSSPTAAHPPPPPPSSSFRPPPSLPSSSVLPASQPLQVRQSPLQPSSKLHTNPQPLQKERRVSYPPTPTSSHDAKAPNYYSIKGSSDHSDGSETTETDDDAFKEKKAQGDDIDTSRRISMPLLSSRPTISNPSTHVATTHPLYNNDNNDNNNKMKPLKKVHHWIIKGKLNESTLNEQQSTKNEDAAAVPSSRPRPPSTPRRLSWEEDDRPSSKKTKRGRPPSSIAMPSSSRPPSLNDLSSSSTANGRQRVGESIVAAAMAAAKGSRRNSIRQSGGVVRNGAAGYSEDVLYCICRKPYDVPRFMIACDRCDQWFHGECIGISEKEGEFIDLYFCGDCAKVTGKSTSWKPKCGNPACPKAARISSHQGRLSKYCTDVCGLQVARARLELAEIKRRNLSEQSYTAMLAERQRRAQVTSESFKANVAKLLKLRDARRHVKQEIAVIDKKLQFLRSLVDQQQQQRQEAGGRLECGFDSRLTWPDHVWRRRVEQEAVATVDREMTSSTAEAAEPEFSVCHQAPCHKHAKWQELKLQEFEQDRANLFHTLARGARLRNKLKMQIRRRRDMVDEGWMSNATILHTKEAVIK